MKKLLFLLPVILLAGCGVQSECKETVKDSLKAPSTAIFSKMETYDTDTFWKVVGWFVESQNSLGAMVWDKFYCVKVGDENVAIFRNWNEERYDELTEIVNTKEKGNLRDKADCEKAIQKALNDSTIKISSYIWDEDDEKFRLNGWVIDYKGEYVTVMCYVDDDKGGVYQVKIDDKVYKVSKQ